MATIEQHARAQARKRQRKLERQNLSTEHWLSCEWCGLRWNPQVKRKWLGKLICPKCENFPRETLHRLIEYKIVKLKKKSNLPTPRTRPPDWGHLGKTDPDRPWMKWVRCEFCTIPICVNNNADHRVVIAKYRGHTICRQCVRLMRVFNKRLVEMKYFKLRS